MSIDAPIKKVSGFSKVVMALAFTGMSYGASVNAAQTFQIGTLYGKDHVMTKMAEKFAEAIEEKTDGEIKVKPRLGSPFGDVYQIGKQIANGQRKLDIVSMSSDVDKRLGIGYMGGLVSNHEEARELYGPGGKFLDVINHIGETAGFKMLSWSPSGFGGIIFRKESTSTETLPSDTRYKVRVAPYKGMIARFEALGFSAVPMPYSETYTALQTGTIDAKGASPAEEAALEFADIAYSYLYSRDYFEGIIGVGVNLDWFNEQPEDIQDALVEAGYEATELAWTDAKEREESFLEMMEDKGVKVIRLSDEEYDEIKKISREAEWPVLRETAGDEIMDMLEEIAF